MSFIKLYQIIDNTFIGRFVDKRRILLESTDPNRIYVENIRRFFNIPYRLAQLLCNLAVRQGYFKKKTAIYCPGCGKSIITIDDREKLPNQISCDICELNEADNFTFNVAECRKVEFYQLVSGNDN